MPKILNKFGPKKIQTLTAEHFNHVIKCFILFYGVKIAGFVHANSIILFRSGFFPRNSDSGANHEKPYLMVTNEAHTDNP